MTCILHLIDDTRAASASEARAFIDGQRGLPCVPNPKFHSFVADITATYPDLSEEDLDGDCNRNIWAEGLDTEANYGEVKELVIKTELADDVVVGELAAAAGRNGLRLYDEEGQVLHPVDGREDGPRGVPTGREGRDPSAGSLGAQCSPQGLRYDGVYQGPRHGGYRTYYRFCPDGALSQVELEGTNPMRAFAMMSDGDSRVANGEFEVEGTRFRGRTHGRQGSYNLGGEVRPNSLLLYRVRADGEEPYSAVFGFVPFGAHYAVDTDG